jgi:hypothetical protein
MEIPLFLESLHFMERAIRHTCGSAMQCGITKETAQGEGMKWTEFQEMAAHCPPCAEKEHVAAVGAAMRDAVRPGTGLTTVNLIRGESGQGHPSWQAMRPAMTVTAGESAGSSSSGQVNGSVR